MTGAGRLPDDDIRDDDFPDGARQEAALRHLEQVADLLDSRFRIPGTRFRFGFDSLLGLVPGIGDAATAIPAIYILLRARGMRAPWPLMARMGVNVAADLAVGSVPVLGDLFDIGFKANRRNVALLRRHFGSPRGGGPAAPGGKAAR